MAWWCLETLVLVSTLAGRISAASLDDSPQQKMEKRARRERQAAQWTRGFYTLSDGMANKYDQDMVVCCFLVESSGVVAQETWGTADQFQKDWWESHDCNKMVGAGVLPVGQPRCDYFRGMKQGYESAYLRDQPYDAGSALCSESDREILNGTIAVQKLNGTNVKPRINLLTDRTDCAPSLLVLSSGRGVNTANLAGCIKTIPLHEGLSESCLKAYTSLLHNVIKLRSVDTFQTCLDICYGVDTCFGMEKCVKKAAECSRCIEPALVRFKGQVGGETPIVQPDLFMRVVMGFEKSWLY